MVMALGVGPQNDVSRVPPGVCNVVVYLVGDGYPRDGAVRVEAMGPCTCPAGELVSSVGVINPYHLPARAEAQPPVPVDFSRFRSNTAVVLYGRYESSGYAFANVVGRTVVC
jgi:hypothetical protein